MEKKVRPIDANALAARIREYMADYPHAETRLAACRALLSMLGNEGQTPTILQPTCNNIATGELLTLDQLRKMDNKPVWVVPQKSEHDYCGWCVVSVSKYGDEHSSAEIPGVEYWDWKFESYGKTWIAYAYPPVNIDREAFCGSWEGEADGYADGELVYDMWRCAGCGHVEETDDPDLLPDFCPVCGLAMTEKARKILEKRLRG